MKVDRDMEITLRKYQLSDADALMKWARDPDVLRYSRLQAWVHPNSTREDIVSFLTKVVIPNPGYWAICLDGHPIGMVSIEPEGKGENDFNRGRAKLAYALGRDHWGRGITTLVVKNVVAAAFKELPQLLRIEAVVDPNNKGSLKVLEKVGFLKEGLLRKYMIVDGKGCDFVIYSLLSTDLLKN